MTERRDPVAGGRLVPAWTMDELIAEGLAALERGEAGDGKLIDGRALAVKASPIKQNSEHIVIGTATLPPGFSTRAHSHSAEEVAVVLRGSGSVDIEGIGHRVGPGSILLTPANLVHVTHSDPGLEPLVVLWFYAPPGAEARWVEPDKHATAGHFGGSPASSRP